MTLFLHQPILTRRYPLTTSTTHLLMDWIAKSCQKFVWTLQKGKDHCIIVCFWITDLKERVPASTDKIHVHLESNDIEWLVDIFLSWHDPCRHSLCWFHPYGYYPSCPKKWSMPYLPNLFQSTAYLSYALVVSDSQWCSHTTCWQLLPLKVNTGTPHYIVTNSKLSLSTQCLTWIPPHQEPPKLFHVSHYTQT